MGIVRAFLSECLLLEFTASDERLRYGRTLNKMLDLDLNLMGESYMHATVENLRSRVNSAPGLTGQGFGDRCEVPSGR